MKLICIVRTAFVGFLWCAPRRMFRYTREIPNLCLIVAGLLVHLRSQTGQLLVHMFQKHQRCFLRIVAQHLFRILFDSAVLIEIMIEVFLFLLRLGALHWVCYQVAPNIVDPSGSSRNYCTGFARRLCFHST